MRRVSRWAAPAALLALVLLATGSATAKVTRVTGAQTFTINVDGFNPKANEDFLAFFPRAITAHAGDTVVFHYVGVGEPHTVTLGTLADNAVHAYNQLTPAEKQSNNPPKSFQEVDAQVPSLFPHGPGDAVQSVANPCYQKTTPVGSDVCPNSQHEQPEFDGSYTYYNSGWFKNNQSWTVHLSGGMSPGTYRFMCALHREDMQGKITVVSSSKTVMSPSSQYALGEKQLAADEKPLVVPVATLRQGKPPVPHVTLPGPNPVLAGSGAPNTSGSVDEFGLSTVHIPVGGTVTWWLLGDHSITFNSDKTNNDVQSEAPDGTIHLNPKAFGPFGGPGEPPPSNGGPTSGIHFKVVASSSWDGQGFHSSGVFVNSFGPPVIEGYKLKFTKAGTYHYICTVHDHMKGTVVVG
jgi:plastocyanin